MGFSTMTKIPCYLFISFEPKIYARVCLCVENRLKYLKQRVSMSIFAIKREEKPYSNKKKHHFVPEIILLCVCVCATK